MQALKITGRKQVVLQQLASINGVFLVRWRVIGHTKRVKLTHFLYQIIVLTSKRHKMEERASCVPIIDTRVFIRATSQNCAAVACNTMCVCVSRVSNWIMWCLIIFYVSVFIKKTTLKTDSECRHFFCYSQTIQKKLHANDFKNTYKIKIINF